MLPDRVSNPGPLTYESGALPIALRGPAYRFWNKERLSLVREMVFLYLRQYKFWILKGIALCRDISAL